MQYPVDVPGLEGEEVVYDIPGVFSGSRLLVNGAPVAKVAGKNHYVLRSREGNDVVVEEKGRGFASIYDPLPKLMVGNRQLQFGTPLRLYEVVMLIGVPFLLLVRGGALGGGIGAVAMVINGRIFRSEASRAGRWLAVIAVTIGAVIIYLVVGTVLGRAMGGAFQ